MTVVIVPYGRPKGDIVRTAYADAGLSDADFELEPEEISKGLRTLNSMMQGWPFNLMGFQQPDYGLGLPEDGSGLDDEDIDGVTMSLAFRLAAGMGKMLSQDVKARYAPTIAALRAKYSVIPTMPFARSTPRGTGSRGLFDGPYIFTD